MPAVLLTFATANSMKGYLKYSCTVLCAVIALSACGKKEKKELTPAQIRVKADSIAQIKIKTLQKQAKEDLDKRMSIEVKPKVDSLRNISRDIQAPPTLLQDGMDDEDETTTDSLSK